MSSDQTRPTDVGSAEGAYWDAFERLKKNRPIVLSKGTSVTQNNVAREAGRDPSALKKDRFPKLIRAIQRYVEEGDKPLKPSNRQLVIASRAKRRGIEIQLAACRAQRDIALSMLVEADAKILELTLENLRLQAVLSAKVTDLKGTKRNEN
jgi:hypothetical protein